MIGRLARCLRINILETLRTASKRIDKSVDDMNYV